MTRKDVWCMVRRRVSDAGIETPIGCYTFRATGITDYLTNGGRIEVAQRNGEALERENHQPSMIGALRM
jgi:integrase/recombinase XerD